MKRIIRSGMQAVITASALMLLCGCAGKSQPARFYTLAVKAQQGNDAGGSGPGVAIGIGPVSLADYLDQSRIITRSGDSRIEQAEFDQWSGSFRDNLTHVLAENIAILMGTDRVSIFPWRSYAPVDYQVIVDVVRFDGQLGNDVVLMARWSVLSGNEKKLYVMKRSEIREDASGSGYEAFVEAQSRALAQLGRQIVTAIQATVREIREANK